MYKEEVKGKRERERESERFRKYMRMPLTARMSCGRAPRKHRRPRAPTANLSTKAGRRRNREDCEARRLQLKEWQVDAITAMRINGDHLEYLVAWTGWPHQDSWEPEENLQYAQGILKDFMDGRPVIQPYD
jgi:hypothetical protein